MKFPLCILWEEPRPNCSKDWQSPCWDQRAGEPDPSLIEAAHCVRNPVSEFQIRAKLLELSSEDLLFSINMIHQL